jgi:DNA-binding CsgD family transcriptional regulator
VPELRAAGPLTQREISVELSISLNTVKGYTKSLYRKLGVSGREDAVAQGRALGLVRPVVVGSARAAVRPAPAAGR